MYQLKKNTYSCRNVFWIFLNFWRDKKKEVLTYFVTYFCQNSSHGGILPKSPLPLSLTAITDHPRAGEVLPGCGLHSGAAPVNIPVSFHVPAAQWAGVAGSQSNMFSCSKCTDVAAPFWPDFQNRSTLLHTCQISEEVSLHLMKVRSKLNGPQYLTDFLDPGSIRVKEPY